MAADAGQVIAGRIKTSPFETVGGSESWAEQRTASVNIVGLHDKLKGIVKPGDELAKYAGWFNGNVGINWFVKTTDLSSPDGVTGELKLALVRCGQGKTKPYNITWDVSMEEVQMKLINHPSVLANCNIDTLLKWHDTEPGLRVESNKENGTTTLSFRYAVWSNGSGYSFVPITGKWDVAYCLAVTQGIETYNKYLPVIIKNSYYLELPGADYNEDRVITGGDITDFSGKSSIGNFSKPPLTIKGYTDKDGSWFKSGDKFTSQPDSTWVRTESWTFTDDTRHNWIYTGNLDNNGGGL